ncbi:hypothetical protein PCC7821_01083 [Planktothrix rubescens NIVA-CYA 18]|nr:hypothetical protein PCC7821_01083 [Planktothrix rubescens NIVA-CYA 18]
MTEIIFLVEPDVEGGYIAQALKCYDGINLNHQKTCLRGF